MLDNTRMIPADIDTLAASIDYHTDVAEDFAPIAEALHRRISEFGRGNNEYGSVIIQPHLLRTSILAKAFLIDCLNIDETTAENVFQANLFHDIGKTHDDYKPHVFTFRDRVPARFSQDNKLHTQKGLLVTDEITAQFNTPSEPVAKFVILMKALQHYHHERFDDNGRHKVPQAQLGQIMQVICLMDAYDGDLIKRFHQPNVRTPAIELDRLQNAPKYQGAFDPELLAMLVAYKEKLCTFEEEFQSNPQTRRYDLPRNSVALENSLGLN